MGVPQNGWFISGKFHLEMDENWGYPILGNLHIHLIIIICIRCPYENCQIEGEFSMCK